MSSSEVGCVSSTPSDDDDAYSGAGPVTGAIVESELVRLACRRLLWLLWLLWLLLLLLQHLLHLAQLSSQPMRLVLVVFNPLRRLARLRRVRELGNARGRRHARRGVAQPAGLLRHLERRRAVRSAHLVLGGHCAAVRAARRAAAAASSASRSWSRSADGVGEAPTRLRSRSSASRPIEQSVRARGSTVPRLSTMRYGGPCSADAARTAHVTSASASSSAR